MRYLIMADAVSDGRLLLSLAIRLEDEGAVRLLERAWAVEETGAGAARQMMTDLAEGTGETLRLMVIEVFDAVAYNTINPPPPEWRRPD